MSWHYRVGFKHEPGDERCYGIIEFYKDLQVEGKTKDGWTDFMQPQGESIDGLRADLVRMLADTYRDETPIDVSEATEEQPS